MHRTIKFEPTGLCVEIPELRMPSAKQTAIKTYLRVKEFLTLALPLVVVGSIVLEVLMSLGWLYKIVGPAEPFMTVVLGLPAVAVIALVFGVLRKEMALQMLIVIFGTSNLATRLTPDQMFVFALVMAIFMPCLAAFAVLLKEFGPRSTVAVAAASMGLALALGALANALLSI
jgi:ferrous iron transport protein B